MTHPGHHWPAEPGSRMQLWTWPGSGPVEWVGPRPAPVPVRIGDTERDRAISALSDHFAAGRLTHEELDERVDQAMQARFDADLRPLFADLPRPESPAPAQRVPASAYPSGPALAFAALFWLVPLLLVIGVVAAVASGAPWIIWGLIWVLILTKVFGRRRYYSQRPRR